MLTTVRFAAALSAVLAALIGALFAFDLIEGAAARAALGKTLAVVALFTLASLAVLLVAGGSRAKS